MILRSVKWLFLTAYQTHLQGSHVNEKIQFYATQKPIMAQISFAWRRKLQITQKEVLLSFALTSGPAHMVLLSWDCSLRDP
jgi:hypothetical protein